MLLRLAYPLDGGGGPIGETPVGSGLQNVENTVASEGDPLKPARMRI